MDPFDPYFTVSPLNPAVQILAFVIAVALICRLWSSFSGDVKNAGVFKTTIVWVWGLAFFPAAFLTANYFGWWALVLGALWFVPVSAFERDVIAPRKAKSTAPPEQKPD